MDYKTIRTKLNFKVLAKLFFDLAEERYPTGDRVRQQISKVVDPIVKDPLDSINLKIKVVSMMRNMVREVSPSKLYRSLQHRDDLYAAIIQAAEDFEDALEELYEKLEEEEEED